MTEKKNNILFWIGIVTAIWFAWTGIVWTYYACLILAYPVGMTLSISSLIYLLIFD